MKFTRSETGSYVCEHADYTAIITRAVASMDIFTGKLRKGQGWMVIVSNARGVAHTEHANTLNAAKDRAATALHKAVYSN